MANNIEWRGKFLYLPEHDRGGKMSRLIFDFSNIYQENIGKEHGISHDDLESLKPRLEEIHSRLLEKKHSGGITYLQLPHYTEPLEQVEQLARDIAGRFDNIVLIGIGGSALGPYAIFRALKSPVYNEIPDREKRGGPRFHVLDNVDPDWTMEIFTNLDLKKTAVLVVTKSGSTAETIATFMVYLGLAKKQNIDVRRHLFFVTDPEKGPLRKLAGEWNIASLAIPPGVGGRFSVLTPVGLLPAAILGVNIRELMEGAREFSDFSFTRPVLESPSFLYAAVHYLYIQRGKPIHVMYPYSGSLYFLADWFRQLWAESLGKRFDRQGKEISVGPTPVKALGATDQHSQVQLYMEGPNDKVFTFLQVRQFREKCPVEGELPFPEFRYLQGATLEKLINAEKVATELALTRNQRPNISVEFSTISPYHLGSFFYFLELATDVAGELLNINAFDQPGVEEGKIATYALMGREGYEQKRVDIERQRQEKKSIIIRF